MKVTFAREPIDPSIFLAGPTPRDKDVKSWRPEAIGILHRLGFKGTVYVPEDRAVYTGEGNGTWEFEYDDQINWEWSALGAASAIVFWVPRNLKDMPAFTTNVEFGLYVNGGKCLFGCPQNAPKNSYLRCLAKRYNAPIFDDLGLLLEAAIEKAMKPF